MKMSLSRRRFLQSALLLTAGLEAEQRGLTRIIGTPATAPGISRVGWELTGAIRQIHDPVIIRGEDAYYLFCTGTGILIRRSVDLLDWERTFPPVVFANLPDWAREKIPGATNIWAPDIAYYNGKYHLYYSVSTFGSNRSVIGLVTNTTLNFDDEAYAWVDEGLVIESTGAENYNCIDPNLVFDADGAPWLAFGSFWSGLKLRRLDFETGKPSAEDETVYDLARRTVNSGAVEAPFIVRKGGFYYLFASFDFCCRGTDSTYHVVVGRSETITGPYVDRAGTPMLRGGGTQITFPTDRWRGPGHNAILQTEDADYIVYHAYDAESRGVPTLRIDRLVWDADGWPAIDAPTA